jgi:hypothetical protein
VADLMERWLKGVEEALDDAILEIAENGEYITRDLRGWIDDTHSAEESITGYVVGKEPYDKNFQSPRWRQAQRHGGGRYGNAPSNYLPTTLFKHHVPAGTRTAIVAGFVHYLPTLETGGLFSSMTFHRALDEMGPEVDRVLWKNLRQVKI